mgnify:CR=1 FL=1
MLLANLRQPCQHGDLCCLLHPRYSGCAQAAYSGSCSIPPEVVGFVCGSFLLALLTKEYKSTAGSSPMVRFILGAAMMIGALVFLGCPLRMVLRMAAGDLNAWVALIGFAGGVATGSFFLKKGFSLGRAYEAKPVGGAVLPVVLAALLVIGVATGAYAVSTEGPGSKHAPIILSLVVALVIGALAQKSRMCFAGSIRDLILMKNFDLISIIAALFAVMAVYNAATGSFHLGFFRSADRAFPAPVEHSWYVCCRLCGCAGWRLPAASAHSGRSGLV